MAEHAVSALPGGQKLVELIDKVTGDPSVIADIAIRWRQGGSTSDTAGSALRAATGGVDGAWQGPAADAFVQYMNGFIARCSDAKTQLDAAAGIVEQAATLLDTTKRTVQDRCHALVSEAASLRAGLPADTPPDQVNAQLAALVDQVYNELRPIVDGADAQLAGLAGQLNQPAGNGFAQYPQPTTAAFAPEPGKPIDWAPQPQDAPTQATGSQPANTGAPSTGGAGPSSGSTGGGSFGGLGPSGGPPPGGGPAPEGQVAEWIQQAIEILKQQGYPVEKMNPNDIWMIIQHESGGDPTAINNWDSNAAKGTPSKGLMQTIDPTFNAHALPGHTNIWNPVDNIIAGVRYAIDRYGSVSNVPGVVGVKTGSGYRGY